MGWLFLTGVAACILQSVVIVHAVVTTCVKNTCSPTSNKRLCEITVNSRGLQGNCISPADVSQHNEADCQNVSPPPGKSCVCSLQSCVNDVITDYDRLKQSSDHLTCHGHICNSPDACLLSASSTNTPHCGSKARHKLCSPALNPNNVCYCDTQTCIDEFVVAHLKDDSVKCGDAYCRIHNNEKCILENTGYTYNYNMNGGGYSMVRQTCSTVHATWCSSTPDISYSCGCFNQICVDRFAPHIIPMTTTMMPTTFEVQATTCSEVHNRLECENLEARASLCETTNTVVHDIAITRCAQYCSLCHHTSLTTTIMPTTQVVHATVCSEVPNRSECQTLDSTAHLCETTNPVIHDIATTRCAQYCSLCYHTSLTTTIMPTTQAVHATVCSEVPNRSECLNLDSTAHLCDSTNPIVHGIATTRCAQYCSLCFHPATTSPTITTTISTTEIITTLKIYPTCVGTICDRYKPHCHFYNLNGILEGKCMPFKVGEECHNYTMIQGDGCTCETTACSVNILSAHLQHTDIQIITSPMTTVTGYDCFGQMCTSSSNYCHLIEYMGLLEGKCMPVTVWKECKTYNDVKETGCTCTSNSCSALIVKDYLNKISATTMMSTMTETSLSTSTVPTTHDTVICEDKPGVDCQVLNATNICANPFSHVYCSAFCGHCTIKIIATGLG